MLMKIGISIVFLMTVAACASGALAIYIEMVKAFKGREWGEGFGMLALFLLLTLIGGGTFVAWICYLGGKQC